MLGHRCIYPNTPRSLRQTTPRRARLAQHGDDTGYFKTSAQATSRFAAPLCLGFLLTCRQTHSEALPIVWSTNTLCFNYSTAMFSTLQSLGSHQTSLIRTLRLNVSQFLSETKRELHYTIPSLTSLQDLRQIQLSIQADEGCLTMVKKMRYSYLIEFF